MAPSCLGPVSPDEFIVAAEQAGLINRITRQVLTDTCQAWAGWRRGHGVDIPVSMNISGYDLLDASLPDAVARSLADWNMPPDRLVLEITETALALTPSGRRHHDRAAGAGVRTALDDFGSGYSSLAQVPTYPGGRDQGGQAVHAGGRPGPPVGADPGGGEPRAGDRGDRGGRGVETELDRQLLLRLDCAVAQGFLYSRPLTSDELVAYVQVHGTADWPEPTRPWAPAEFGAGGVISRAERRLSGG